MPTLPNRCPTCGMLCVDKYCGLPCEMLADPERKPIPRAERQRQRRESERIMIHWLLVNWEAWVKRVYDVDAIQ